MFGLSFPLWRRAHSHVPAARRSCQPQLEELETRLVMTAKITLANGVLQAVANNKPTTVTLRQVGASTIVNGFKASTKAIKRIEILGGAKADTVVIQDTPAGKPVVVKTGGGKDVIEVGTSGNLMSGIKGQLKVDAGAGDDLVRLFAGATATKLTLNGGGGVNSLAGLPASGSTVAHSGFGRLIGPEAIAPPLPPAVGQFPGIGQLLDPASWGPSLEAKAVQLDTTLDLYLPPEMQWENWGGQGEKWMLDVTNRLYYYILPSGELYRWDESSGRAISGERVATLDPSYHQDLNRLTEAQSLLAAGQIQGPTAEQAAQLDRDFGLHVENQDVWLNWGGRNEKWLMSRTDQNWYFILPNGELHSWDFSDTASGELVATLDASFYDDLSKVTEARERFGDLDSLAQAAIRRRHLGLDGNAGNLGAAVTGLQTTADGNAWFVTYQHGAIYWTVGRGALAVTSGSWPTYAATGAHDGPLGLPTAEAQKIKGGLAGVTLFEHGAIYGSEPTGVRAVYGAIYAKYQALGGHDGFLGLPTTDELMTPDGVGRFNHFQGGSIYWTLGTGAWEVHGAIRDKWASMDWERSTLGYPISDEQSVLGDAYRLSSFQGGTIVWEKATGKTFAVYGLIHAKWLAHGGIAGWMGAPTSDELDVPGGRVSHFQNSSIYFKWGTREAFQVQGLIRDRYHAMGGPWSGLGLPKTDEFTDDSGGRVSLFERGDIYFSVPTGVRTHVYRMALPEQNAQNDSWSCGPNSMSRVLGYYGFMDATYETVRGATQENNLLSDLGLGTQPDNLLEVGRRWKPDLRMEEGASLERLLQVLDSGKPVIVLVSRGEMLSRGATVALGAAAGAAIGGPWGAIVGATAGATAGAVEDVPKLHYMVVTGYDGRTGSVYIKNTNQDEFTMSYADFLGQWNFHQSPIIGKGFLEGVMGITTKTMIY